MICCYCQVASVVSNSVRPHRRSPPGSTIPGILQARNSNEHVSPIDKFQPMMSFTLTGSRFQDK